MVSKALRALNPPSGFLNGITPVDPPTDKFILPFPKQFAKFGALLAVECRSVRTS
jgi:hypothetical protein